MLDHWRIATDLNELLDGAHHNLKRLAEHLEAHPNARAEHLLAHARARLVAARAYLLFLDSDDASAAPCSDAGADAGIGAGAGSTL